MQHHTGQHILTQAFVQIAGAQTIGFHLGSDVVTIDLDKVDLPLRQVGETEDLANQIIVDDRPVTIHIIDPDEADHVRMRRMPDQLLTGGLRVIEVEDFDTTACGGTHVARTGEIGLLKILRLEAKGDGTRVEFLCGGRALADYREKHDILTGLAADLTTGYRDVPDSLDKLRSELKNGQKALKRATEQLVIYEAEHLLAAAEQHGDVRVVKAAPETFDAGDQRALASRLIEAGGVVALLGIPGEASQLLFARSADLPYDMNPAIRAAFAALGEGRGGGRPEFVQGGGAAATAAQLMNAFAAAETNLFETDS
jgi:alanyl-tRNA synthetase